MQARPQFDPLLREQFFTVPPQVESDGVEAPFELPESKEAWKDFFENKDKRDKFLQGIRDKVGELRKWCEEQGLTLFDRRTFDARVKGFLNKFEGKPEDSYEFNLCTEGVRAFVKIVGLIHSEAIPLDTRKMVVQNLISSIDVCGAGTATHLYNSYEALITDPRREIMSVRRKIAEQLANELINGDAGLRQDAEMIIHHVNTILNYYADSLGIIKLEDVYALRANELDNLRGGDSRITIAESFQAQIPKRLTPEGIIDYIINFNLAEIGALSPDPKKQEAIKRAKTELKEAQAEYNAATRQLEASKKGALVEVTQKLNTARQGRAKLMRSSPEAEDPSNPSAAEKQAEKKWRDVNAVAIKQADDNVKLAEDAYNAAAAPFKEKIKEAEGKRKKAEAEHSSLIEKSRENFNSLLDHLNRLGSDPSFYSAHIVDEDYQLKETALDYLRISLLHRLSNSGYFDLTNLQELAVDGATIYLLPEHSLKLFYVIDANNNREPFIPYCVEQCRKGNTEIIMLISGLSDENKVEVVTALMNILRSEAVSLFSQAQPSDEIKKAQEEWLEDLSRMLSNPDIKELVTSAATVGMGPLLDLLIALPQEKRDLAAVGIDPKNIQNREELAKYITLFPASKWKEIFNTMGPDKIKEIIKDAKGLGEFFQVLMPRIKGGQGESESLSLLFNVSGYTLVEVLGKLQKNECLQLLTTLGVDYLKTIITTASGLVSVLDSLPYNDQRLNFLQTLGMGHVGSIIKNGEQLASVLNKLPKVDRLDFLKNSLNVDYLKGIIKDDKQLASVLVALGRGSDRYLEFLKTVGVDYLKSIITNGAQLVGILNEAFLIKFLPQDNGYLQFLNTLNQDHLKNIINNYKDLFSFLFKSNFPVVAQRLLFDNLKKILGQDHLKNIDNFYAFVDACPYNAREILYAHLDNKTIIDHPGLCEMMKICKKNYDNPITLLTALGKDALRDIIQDGNQLAAVLRELPSDDERLQLLTALGKDALRDIIKDGNELAKVLLELPSNEERLPLPLLTTLDKNIIKDGNELAKVLLELPSDEERLKLLTALGKDDALRDIIQDGNQLAAVLHELILDETRLPVLKALDQDLPKIIPDNKGLVAVLNTLPAGKLEDRKGWIFADRGNEGNKDRSDFLKYFAQRVENAGDYRPEKGDYNKDDRKVYEALKNAVKAAAKAPKPAASESAASAAPSTTRHLKQ